MMPIVAQNRSSGPCLVLFISDVAQMDEQLGGQDGTTSGSADGVVRETGKFVVKQWILAQAANGDAHAMANFSVENRLGPVVFGKIGQERGRSGGQLGLLRVHSVAPRSIIA